LQLLLQESAGNQLTTVLTIHVPSSPGRAVNTLVAIREGAIIASYANFISTMRSAFRSHGWLTLATSFRR
jgi:hypothetical protein